MASELQETVASDMIELDSEYLAQLEEEAKERYSENDKDFMAHCSKPVPKPPILPAERFQRRHHGNFRGRNRPSYQDDRHGRYGRDNRSDGRDNGGEYERKRDYREYKRSWDDVRKDYSNDGRNYGSDRRDFSRGRRGYESNRKSFRGDRYDRGGYRRNFDDEGDRRDHGGYRRNSDDEGMSHRNDQPRSFFYGDSGFGNNHN